MILNKNKLFLLFGYENIKNRAAIALFILFFQVMPSIAFGATGSISITTMPFASGGEISGEFNINLGGTNSFGNDETPRINELTSIPECADVPYSTTLGLKSPTSGGHL